MSNEIIKHKDELRTWDDKRVRISKEELLKALSPMFVTFPGLEMPDETFAAYYMMLSDLQPDRLVKAVLKACSLHEYPTQLITVAAIRKAYESEQRAPENKSLADYSNAPVRTKMYQPSKEEDERQRRAQLRQRGGRQN
jgi:hypothetical protein